MAGYSTDVRSVMPHASRIERNAYMRAYKRKRYAEDPAYGHQLLAQVRVHA